MRVTGLIGLLMVGIMAALFGCMKNGDGVGITANGQRIVFDPCKADPTAKGCPMDPCVMHPTTKGCPQYPCILNPASSACHAESCSVDSTLPSCKVDPCTLDTGSAECHDEKCKADSTLSFCHVDPCIANPNLPQCKPAVDCTTLPKKVECLDKDYFTKNVAPILKANCEVCHSPTGQAWPTTKLSLETATGWDSLVYVYSKEMVAPKPKMYRVLPGMPDSSYMYWKLTKATPPVGVRMPYQLPALLDGDIAIIRTWIVGKQ